MTRRQKACAIVWPAYEVKWADQYIAPETLSDDQKKQFEDEEKELRLQILAHQGDNLKAIVEYATQLHVSEGTRKETLEGKAATIAQSAGIVTVIVSIVPAFSGRSWTSTVELKWTLMVLLGAVVMHLAMALRMAIAVRSVRAFYLPSAYEFIDLLDEKPDNFLAEMAALNIMRAKRNEATLGMKSNRLVAAERYYQRGLAFFVGFVLCALLLG